jgi:PBP1b-binding outer membrane lipoprotein LpoB
VRKTIPIVFGLLLFAGCVGEDGTKTSHFEHDHEIAPHWPSDLADAAAKIRERLEASEKALPQSEQLAIEIADIVSWVPEIAADTNLSEQDWVPLDLAAAALSAKLRAADNELTESNRKQMIALCELIEQTVIKIPDQLPSWRGTSS